MVIDVVTLAVVVVCMCGTVVCRRGEYIRIHIHRTPCVGSISLYLPAVHDIQHHLTIHVVRAPTVSLFHGCTVFLLTSLVSLQYWTPGLMGGVSAPLVRHSRPRFTWRWSVCGDDTRIGEAWVTPILWHRDRFSVTIADENTGQYNRDRRH